MSAVASTIEATGAPPTLWFAEDGGRFHGREPFFYDTSGMTWVSELEAQASVIDEELAALIASSDTLEPYGNSAMTSRAGRWKTFGLMFWHIRSARNCARCPRTWRIVSRIPGLCAASFNLLEPQTTIKPHHGDTNGVIRCHLGLRIPATAPRCGFRVGDETRSWEPGRLFAFCDAHEHTAWNNSDEPRYILMLDVMRPEFMTQRRRIASRVLASIAMAIQFQRRPWLRRWMGGPVGKPWLFRFLRLVGLVPFTRFLLSPVR